MSEATQAAPPREGLISRILRLRRGPWEGLATLIIAAGLIMLMQPLWIVLYTYSFVTILVGTVMFVVVSHFGD
jgi:hypothetical protein